MWMSAMFSHDEMVQQVGGTSLHSEARQGNSRLLSSIDLRRSTVASPMPACKCNGKDDVQLPEFLWKQQ